LSKDSLGKPPFHCHETFDEQLALTLESILDGFFACDADWRMVYLNSSAEAVFGHPREEVLGKSIWEFPPFSQDTTLVQEYMRAAAGETRVFDAFVEPTGRWFQHRCFPRTGGGISVLLQNITHNKLKIQKLQGSEEKYRSLVESTNDCLWESDVQGRFTYLSPNFEKITGYPPDAFLGKSSAELFPQNHKYQPNELRASLVSGQTLQGLEYSFRNRDGRIITVEVSISPIISSDGAYLGQRGVTRDITKRKKAEIALAEKEEMYRLLVDNLQNAVVYQITGTLGGNRRFTYISHAVERLNETTVEEVLADPAVIYRQILPEYHEMLYEREEEALKNVSPLHVEVQSRLPSGRLRWFEYTTTPRRQNDGHVVWDGVQLDITERKQTEEALRDLSQRLTYHVDNSPLAVIEWGPDMRLIRWSGEAESIFGWKAEEVLGKRMEDFRWIYEEDNQHVAEVSSDLQTGNYPSRFSANRNYHKDGSVVYCEWYSSSLLDESGNLKSILSLVLDVTERKQAETALKASLAEKEVLLQEVHHRVKNNLTSIISLLDLQKEWITDKAALDSLKIIADRIMSMALIHQRFYRSNNIGCVDFQEYLSDLTTHLLNSYGGSSFINCRIDAGEIELALDTAIPIGLIVNELVTNAMKHAFPSGRPRVGSEDCEILIKAHENEGTITLSIADNGIGMPPNHDWKSISSFGLRLVRMLAEDQLKGKIQFDHEEGTQFILKFSD